MKEKVKKRKISRYKIKGRRLACMGFSFVTIVCLSVFLGTPNAEGAEPADIPEDYTRYAPTLYEQTIVQTVEESIETGFTEIVPFMELKAEFESLGEFTLTAYCTCPKCCEEWSAEHPSRAGTGFVQKTASGTIPTPGRTISVDPRVIPFGMTVLIDGREYVAEDCGGAIKGNRIDILFKDHNETLDFGRQKTEVFIKTNEEI